MSDLFDYLAWRGDLTFEQAPFGPVDGLILTTMCYVRLLGIVPSRPDKSVPLKRAVRGFLALSQQEQEARVRVKRDIELMAALGETPRFANLMLSGYTDYLEEETQFAVIAVGLKEGETFLAYRGTDRTLAGWKEDLNMSYQETVPAQRFAKEYLEEFAPWVQGDLILGGHSKGGNLAMYAVAMCPPEIRNRVKAVYSYDGLGFGENVLNDEGYREVKPRLHSFLPESSVVGVIMEHRVSHTVVKSRSIGVLQHGPYSWMVQGNNFILADERSESSHVMEQAIRNWSATMSQENREELVEKIYDLLQAAEVDRVEELVRPKNILRVLRAVRKDREGFGVLKDMLGQFVKTILQTARERKKRNG